MFWLLSFAAARLTNEEFSTQDAFKRPLGIDDTHEMSKLKADLAALPELFGYTVDDGSKLFPPYFYPRCEDRYRSSQSVTLDYESDTVELTCYGDKPGALILGPFNDIKISNPTDAKKHWKVIEYEGEPIPIEPHHEFVLATCGDPKESAFNVHDVKPRFKEEAYLDALSKIRSKDKPVIILLATVDSFSRRHFFRKLPATVNYLNELKTKGKYAVFDFKLHNIIGADTSENMMRVFGQKWVRGFSGSQNVDFHGDQAIWTLLKKYGFMTLLGSDACNHNVPKSMGRVPKVDHAVNMFYCANYIYGNYRASKFRAMQQRCLGGHMAHHWLMNYSLQFSKNYSKANQWIFAHFTAAHEMTGQHAATLNDDLKNWIQQYLDELEETHEVVILLHGDHGMRYGEFLSAKESIQEHRLPAFFMIASHEFLKKFEYSYDTLTQNTMRLNTKPDLRETMLDIGAYAGGFEYEKNQENFYSLISEVIPMSRTCDNAEIPVWYCSTYLPKPQPDKIYKPELKAFLNATEAEMAVLVQELSQRVVYTMNEEVFTTTVMKPGLLCAKVSFDAIKTVSYVEISPTRHVFRIMLSVEQSKTAEIDAWIVLAMQPVNEENMKHDNYLAEPITYRGKKLYARILSILRTDKYGGECEAMARALTLNPQYCFCKKEAKEYLQKVVLKW
mmetsp:Transcript_5274/g.9677  ORF Transcript_5274/g.9677 Transcript_5274/m.9677 type:complete len:673 (-) Transcript_5274:10-2028(-)